MGLHHTYRYIDTKMVAGYRSYNNYTEIHGIQGTSASNPVVSEIVHLKDGDYVGYCYSSTGTAWTTASLITGGVSTTVNFSATNMYDFGIGIGGFNNISATALAYASLIRCKVDGEYNISGYNGNYIATVLSPVHIPTSSIIDSSGNESYVTGYYGRIEVSTVYPNIITKSYCKAGDLVAVSGSNGVSINGKQYTSVNNYTAADPFEAVCYYITSTTYLKMLRVIGEFDCRFTATSIYGWVMFPNRPVN